MDKKVRTAGEVISRLFESIEQENFEQANQFIKSWKAVVGERIASHSKVIDVNKGVLVVEVDHPGWSQQLLLNKKKILGELSGQFPELSIQTMSIRITSVCTSSYTRQEAPVGSGIPRISRDEPVPELDESLDDPLQNVLKKLRESMKKGKPS